MRARTAATAVATVALVGSVVAVGAMAVPVVATAARQDAPSSAEPVVTVTVTAPPPSSAPSASASAAAYSGPLIAPTGSRVRTRAELHDWVETRPWAGQDPANTAIWEQQAWLDMRCMADAGYLYDPIAEQEQDASGLGLTEAERDGYQAAMYGPPTSDPYDWRRAGCHGRSVHLTGQDDAH